MCVSQDVFSAALSFVFINVCVGRQSRAINTHSKCTCVSIFFSVRFVIFSTSSVDHTSKGKNQIPAHTLRHDRKVGQIKL